MAALVKIGNSQGVRLPKTIIKQAHLENANLEFEVLNNGLLIKPVDSIGRESWEANIKSVLAANKEKKDEGKLNDFLNDSDLDDYR